MKIILAALLAVAALCAGTAHAAVYKVTIINHLHQKVVGVSIVGGKGKVLDFRPTDEERFELRVDLPESSVCNPEVRFRLGIHYRAALRIPLCQGGEYEIYWGR